jgi:hypothetical protein
MKKQGTGNRDQGTVERLLREALPPVTEDAGAARDLWPAMQRRLHAEAAPVEVKMHVPWFDWALAAGLVALLALFPAWIPVLLYYL